MIIRLSREADDIRPCAALDHGHLTGHVWQMDTREQPNGVRVTFRSMHLPREIER